MDEKALLEAMMLDEADLALLAPDLAKIASMIGRAAEAVAELQTAPAKPDAAWLRMVPETDPAVPADETAAVRIRHEITVSGVSVPAERMTVPRVVGGGDA